MSVSQVSVLRFTKELSPLIAMLIITLIWHLVKHILSLLKHESHLHQCVLNNLKKLAQQYRGLQTLRGQVGASLPVHYGYWKHSGQWKHFFKTIHGAFRNNTTIKCLLKRHIEHHIVQLQDVSYFQFRILSIIQQSISI